jgi:hypothetical protein
MKVELSLSLLQQYERCKNQVGTSNFLGPDKLLTSTLPMIDDGSWMIDGVMPMI